MIQLFYPFIEERSWMWLDFFLSVIRIQLRLCFQFLIPRWAKEITLKEPQQRTKQEIHSIVQLMKQLKGFRRYSFKIQEAICAALKYDWYDKKQPLKFRVLFVRRKKIWILTLKNYCWVYSSLDASHGIMFLPIVWVLHRTNSLYHECLLFELFVHNPTRESNLFSEALTQAFPLILYLLFSWKQIKSAKVSLVFKLMRHRSN